MNYLTDRELKRIRNWPGDYESLFDFIEGFWTRRGTFRRTGNTYRLTTGGWSGNEEVIYELQKNTMFWVMCWQMSKRGGLYVFKLPRFIKRPR